MSVPTRCVVNGTSVRACAGPAGPSGRGTARRVAAAVRTRGSGHSSAAKRGSRRHPDGLCHASGRREARKRDTVAAGAKRAPKKRDRGGTTRSPGQGEEGDPSADHYDGKGGEGKADTELIFRLERRGSGWGEEILPHIVVEQREVQPPTRRNRRRVGAPEPWEVGSLEWFLERVGVPEEEIEAVVINAIAWRVTGGGRLLIDRRRRARVERNMESVAQYLQDTCGVPQTGVAKVISSFPQILLCKPSLADRWDRRFIELSAFHYFNGHCNVPEEDSQFPDLPQWTSRQRTSFLQNNMGEERQRLLLGLGFKFGEIASITEEWENFFDQLVEWRMWHETQGTEMDWNILHWGQAGGPQARRLAIWVQLQREFKRRHLLSPEAVNRLAYLGIEWEQHEGEESGWVSRFGQLVYLQEEALQAKAKKGRVNMVDTAIKPGSKALTNSSLTAQQSMLQVGWRRPVHSSGGRLMEANLPVTAAAAGRLEETDGGESKRSRRAPPVEFLESPIDPSQQLTLKLEPGVRFWLAKQRWLWRRGMLPREQMLLLGYTAIDMDIYSQAEWLKGVESLVELMRREERRYAENGEQRRDLRWSPLQMQRWVLTQNALWRQKGLSPQRINQIREAELSWVLPDEVLHMGNSQWVKRFQELADIIHTFGGTKAASMVPDELREWILLQRCLQRLNLLPEDRARLFQHVDLNLEQDEQRLSAERWEEHFADLLAFRQQYGHCSVPPDWHSNPSLPVWLRQQLERVKAGSLPDEQREQLLEIGLLDGR